MEIIKSQNKKDLNNAINIMYVETIINKHICYNKKIKT